ncbi:MAG: HIT domain-containing protein [Chloroflexi bacterium]|nr:HIT domain-containing protein [Chloroflexota bacterium]
MKEILWTPWRMAYIVGTPKLGCVLCEKPRGEHDRENLVLFRGPRAYVLMNLYPYNPGHLMVAPYQHAADLGELDAPTRAELMELTERATAVLRRTMNPHGFNLGMNLGRVAGAGIADHLHLHVVPRWEGDTNFMPVVGETKVLPETLEATYDRLRLHWDVISSGSERG